MLSPAIAPVCEEAARAPSAVRPDLTTRIGFFLDTRLAISVKEKHEMIIVRTKFSRVVSA